jgi:hypothetical protein
MTAGRGSEGAGEAERRMDGDDPNEDRRLCEVGGFMGSAMLWGVPGADGIGDAAWSELSLNDVRECRSGGAGLLEDILRRAGRSILLILWCGSRVNSPDFVLRV